MITKEITLCGKQVMLGYCFATEISYKVLSDEDIADFWESVNEAIQKNVMPEPRKTINLILAAMIPYYESKKEQAPIEDRELMYESTPVELGQALGEIIKMRGEFYHVPSGEPEDNQQQGKGKKRKNA